jgi:hypothetical protein
MPGEHRVISLMKYQPKTGQKMAVRQLVNIKYWMSEGSAPIAQNERVSCPSWDAYYSSLENMSYPEYAKARFLIPWRYTKATQFLLVNGLSRQLIFPFGTWTFSCGGQNETEVVVNNSDSTIRQVLGTSAQDVDRNIRSSLRTCGRYDNRGGISLTDAQLST